MQKNNRSETLLSRSEPAPSPWLAEYNKDIHGLHPGTNPGDINDHRWEEDYGLRLIGEPGSARIAYDRNSEVKGDIRWPFI